MCLPPDAYVYARVYERLASRGVGEAAARGVAMKVARRYALRRRESTERARTLDGELENERRTDVDR